VWGTVAGASLVVGGVVALRVSLTRRTVGLIMAFGAGVLLSAVAYELVHEAFETSAGDGGVAIGLLSGSVVFFGAEKLVERVVGGGAHESSDDERVTQAGRAIVLGPRPSTTAGSSRDCSRPSDSHSRSRSARCNSRRAAVGTLYDPRMDPAAR
jgi:zinc transporter ZupT